MKWVYPFGLAEEGACFYLQGLHSRARGRAGARHEGGTKLRQLRRFRRGRWFLGVRGLRRGRRFLCAREKCQGAQRDARRDPMPPA